MTSFHDLGLAEPILEALRDERHLTPTPIQSAAIPSVLAGRDLFGIAQTGTGKTAAFALPILDRLSRTRRTPVPRRTRVLVLTPTRELAGQILERFKAYGSTVRPRTALAIGGVPMGRQVRALAAGVDILVATPGRLVDLVESNAVRLDRVEVLVLDEADQMLDMGFIHAIRKIAGWLPQDRQSLFFSATLPAPIRQLAGTLLNDPAHVAVTPAATTADRVDQRVIHVEKAAKASLLADILKAEPIERALVFTRTKHGADKVVRLLARAGVPAGAIHGNKSQVQREKVLAAFRAGEIRTLIATDIAARGIDVAGVSHVVNYDLPNVPESYVHRIGRTARAGAEGIAISFCDPEEAPLLRAIEALTRLPIPASRADGNVPPDASRASDGSAGRGQGGRRGRGGATASAPRANKRRDRPQGSAKAKGDRGARRTSARPEEGVLEEGIGALPFMRAPSRRSERHEGANRPLAR